MGNCLGSNQTPAGGTEQYVAAGPRPPKVLPPSNPEKAAAVEQVKLAAKEAAAPVEDPAGISSQKFDSVYKLNKELGHGNFSVVKEATHKQSGKKYAVKCIKRADLPKEDEEALFMEVKILKQLNHANIVEIVSFHKEKHFYYLVMEILKGGELFDRIVLKQYYNEKEARDVLKVLLGAISYCHDRTIVHRDLKPENLLLVSEEDNADLKVADFGFARPSGSDGLVTQCGTPGYVAPEILRGHPYGAPVDMWSVGVITFILLGGYPPFHDENKALLYKKIKKGKVVFHPQYWDQVSQEAKNLINAMLTVDPAERITAKEALKHPWITGSDEELLKHDLGVNLEQLKLFNARRKFRSAIQSVVAAQKLHKLVGNLEAMGGPSTATTESAAEAEVKAEG